MRIRIKDFFRLEIENVHRDYMDIFTKVFPNLNIHKRGDSFYICQGSLHPEILNNPFSANTSLFYALGEIDELGDLSKKWWKPSKWIIVSKVTLENSDCLNDSITLSTGEPLPIGEKINIFTIVCDNTPRWVFAPIVAYFPEYEFRQNRDPEVKLSDYEALGIALFYEFDFITEWSKINSEKD